MRDGSKNGDQLLADAKKVTKGYFNSSDAFTKATNINLKDINGLSANDSKVQAKRAELESYKQGLLEARAKYGKTVSLYQGRIEYLQGLLNSDLSKLGSKSSGSSSKETEQKISEYIGKL